jgi:hypothetical protein
MRKEQSYLEAVTLEYGPIISVFFSQVIIGFLAQSAEWGTTAFIVEFAALLFATAIRKN